MNSIGGRLKEERLRLAKTQPEMAAIGGVGKTTQINYEKDQQKPDAGYLAAVASIGVDVLYVVLGQRQQLTEGDLTTVEGVVLDNFRALPDTDKAIIQRLTDSLVQTNGELKKSA